MTSEKTTLDTGLDDLLNRHFPGKVVRKDLTKLVKEGAIEARQLEAFADIYLRTRKPIPEGRTP